MPNERAGSGCERASCAARLDPESPSAHSPASGIVRSAGKEELGQIYGAQHQERGGANNSRPTRSLAAVASVLSRGAGFQSPAAVAAIGPASADFLPGGSA